MDDIDAVGEEIPGYAMSIGWCQYCSEQGIERTDQQYSLTRKRWICLRCGAQVVTPERYAEICEAVKETTGADIWR